MKQKAFSLVELLVVMAIVSVLAVLSVPAFEQMVKASRVTIAGRTVVDELSLARQTALSRNLPVEVRFYKLPGEQKKEPVYRAMQCFLGDQVVAPMGKPVFFPPGVCILEDGAPAGTTRSSLFLNPGPLAKPTATPGTEGVSLPKYGNQYDFISFRFRGNGETDMTAGAVGAFFTLVSQADLKGGTALPQNFVTIQIDALNGRTRFFRP